MKKRGFTLIELLAVIVILAIIALIATPIVLNMISSAKKSAAIDSAYGYIEAIEYKNTMADLNGTQAITSTDAKEINGLIDLKGTKPTSGTIKYNGSRVLSAKLCINGYNVIYEKNVATVKGNCGAVVTWDKPVAPKLDTETKKYKITNPNELRYVVDHASELVTSSNANSNSFSLENDIDLGAEWDEEGNLISGENWIASISSLKGVFNGNGHTISGLYIKGDSSNNLGFFNKIDSTGIINDLHIEGYIEDTYSDLSNNVVQQHHTGGIAGVFYGEMNNCSFSGIVKGPYEIGGIAGYAGGIINKSYNTGNISSTLEYNQADVGGLIGASYHSEIYESYNSGNIKSSSVAGGIAGYASMRITISDSYNSGKIEGLMVSGLTNIGGSGGPSITNSYNIGAMLVPEDAPKFYTSASNLLIGYGNAYIPAASINNYYLKDNITILNGNSVKYWTNAPNFEIGKTSEEMKAAVSLLGDKYKADTNNINGGYPILAWQ